MTHKQELLAWFRRGLSITPAEAVDRWNNYRLADTVYRLREDGHNVRTETMEHINANGRRVTYARYHYVSGPRGETVTPRPVCTPCDPAPAKREANGLQRLWQALRNL